MFGGCGDVKTRSKSWRLVGPGGGELLLEPIRVGEKPTAID